MTPFFDLPLAVNNFVGFAVVHFEDGDEVVRIAGLYSLCTSEAWAEI